MIVFCLGIYHKFRKETVSISNVNNKLIKKRLNITKLKQLCFPIYSFNYVIDNQL